MNAILMGTAIMLAAPAIKDKEPGIVGEWTLVSTFVGGREMPKPPEAMTYEYTADGKYFSRMNGVETKNSRRGYKIDAKKDPAELDFESGPLGKTVWVPGIFKVEGDKLTVCLDGGTSKRPTSFEHAKDARVSIMTFKRVSKKD